MDPTIWDMAKPIIAGQVRHALTGVAGGLVVLGALQSNETTAFVNICFGLTSYAAGALWSWWQKEGQAAVKAKFASLKNRVNAIPSAPIGAGPTEVPAGVGHAIDIAKDATQ